MYAFRLSSTYVALVAKQLDWDGWARSIQNLGLTIDRPRLSAHPAFPEIVYPLDYGYINATCGTDGDELDVFVGTARTGLVGLLLTTDYRKGDREAKLLYNCSPEEVYLANGFINYDPTLMTGRLVLRYPMPSLWKLTEGGRART